MDGVELLVGEAQWSRRYPHEGPPRLARWARPGDGGCADTLPFTPRFAPGGFSLVRHHTARVTPLARPRAAIKFQGPPLEEGRPMCVYVAFMSRGAADTG